MFVSDQKTTCLPNSTSKKGGKNRRLTQRKFEYFQQRAFAKSLICKQLFFLFFFSSTFLFAAPATISPHIHIDQLGYRTADEKVCIISDPQVGYNSGQSFSPGNTYEVRRWSDDVVVFSANITAWNGGAIHAQSGDKVWWFDFSSVTTPGEYYVFDPDNVVGSEKFRIAEDVYNQALKQALRAFYYQRCGTAKEATYAGAWSDNSCHTGNLQDTDCRLVTDPSNPATSKDLSGGWHDAGDYNKYVNYTYSALHDLLFAYQENPAVFGDDYNIPESGDGIPDILNEVKWELDWLLKMQEADGSVLMKVSVSCWQSASPPSADGSQRMYGQAQSSATRVLASVFAHAAIIYASLGIPAMNTFADTLKARAELAWTWLQNNPGVSTYNNNGFCSSNPEMSAIEQEEVMIGAAVMLFAATGNNSYRTYFDNNYTSIRPYAWTYWYAFQPTIQDIMLYYTSLSGATASVTANIQANCIASMNSNNPNMLTAWQNEEDAYRAYMEDADYVWGNNRHKAHTGLIFYNMITYNLSPAQANDYRHAAESFLHYLHGVNPIKQCMLTNMYNDGVENPCDEMYHGWFADGTNYDNAQSSNPGPAPGFLTGGCNPNFAPDPAYGGTIEPPQNQPIQKSYKDWNTGWPENSWEITEPSISNQAAYVKLLSKFSGNIVLSLQWLSFQAKSERNLVQLNWTTANEQNLRSFTLQRSYGMESFQNMATIPAKGNSTTPMHYNSYDTLPANGSYYYRLQIQNADGSIEYSNIIPVEWKSEWQFSLRPNPAKEYVEIFFEASQGENPITLSLYHASGLQVRKMSLKTHTAPFSLHLDLSDLKPGLYYLNIQSARKNQAVRLIIQQ